VGAQDRVYGKRAANLEDVVIGRVGVRSSSIHFWLYLYTVRRPVRIVRTLYIRFAPGARTGIIPLR
jgi:hypothetical protein